MPLVKASSKGMKGIMKNVLSLLGCGLVSLLAGCSTVNVAPVGPNPNSAKTDASTGYLMVYSRMMTQDDDQNLAGDGIPPWHQYSAYNIYDLNGNLAQRVANSSGHYGRRADRVALPPGKYIVRAQAKDYFWLNIPVTVESGRTTRVHLDDNWRPPGDKGSVVNGPDGNPIGWRATPQ